VPDPVVLAFALLVELPFAPALAEWLPPPPLPPPLELPLDVLEALAEPLGPDEDALEWLPLLLEAEPAAMASWLKEYTESNATDATSDDLVMK
jgi:hypothetical protein